MVVISVLTSDLPDTIFGKQFAELESHVKAAGIPYTLLRLPIFLDNQYGNVGSIKGQGTWYDGIEPEKPFTPVAISGKWVRLLLFGAREKLLSCDGGFLPLMRLARCPVLNRWGPLSGGGP